jgi:hypothetical protein
MEATITRLMTNSPDAEHQDYSLWGFYGVSLLSHKSNSWPKSARLRARAAIGSTLDVRFVQEAELGRAAPTRIRKSDGCAECPYVATSMRRPMRAAWR